VTLSYMALFFTFSNRRPMTSLTYTSIDVTAVRNVFEAMMAVSVGVRDSENCWFTEEIGT